jgi:hypothetical protein
VGDVDDGDVLGREVADDPEQVFDLPRVEHCRRLIHHDELGVVRQCPGHAHDLLARCGQPSDLTVGVDLAMPEPGQQLAGQVVRLARLGHSRDADFVPEVDVLRYGEPVDQVELLVDRCDAPPHRGLRVGEPDRIAAPGDHALVGLVGTGEHLDQGRLAGTVLPEQSVHLTRAYVEVDTVEGANPGELLDDAGHRQQRRLARVVRHGSFSHGKAPSPRSSGRRR